MNVRSITSLREFDDLAPEWQHMTRESGQGSPFLSHDWFACCWRAAGARRRREAWIFEDDAGPLAIVPLVMWRTRVRRLPVRTISLMDAPDTGFADVPVARGLEEVLGRLFELLRARRDWDVLWLPKLRADAASTKLLQSLLATGVFPWRVYARQQSPYIALSGTWEKFFHERSQRFRKTVRNVENRLERLGKITVEEHRNVDPDGPVFAELMDVAYRSWKGPRGLSMATMNGMQRFFRELTRRAVRRGSLRLWMLRMDGRSIATEYQLVGSHTVHALRADFDGALAKVSPGSYLNAAIVRSLFNRQEALEYDMGPGTNEYKLRWATDAHDLTSLAVYAPTAYGRFLYCLETRVVPTARRVSQHLCRLCRRRRTGAHNGQSD